METNIAFYFMAVGLVALLLGIGLWSVPLMFIVGGVIVFTLGIIMALATIMPKPKKE